MICGIHHVTAIADPRAATSTSTPVHLGCVWSRRRSTSTIRAPITSYYGDESGQPGTILTFFPWEHAGAGRLGVGEAQETVFRVPGGSLGNWTSRFVENGVAHETLKKRFGQTMVSFKDPDGVWLALAAVPGAESEWAWRGGDVPTEHAIRRLHSVSLLLREAAPTGAILTDVLGFSEVGREDSTVRFIVRTTEIGGIVDFRVARNSVRGRQGAGSVHHGG